MITVKQLIQQLQQFDEDMPVTLSGYTEIMPLGGLSESVVIVDGSTLEEVDTEPDEPEDDDLNDVGEIFNLSLGEKVLVLNPGFVDDELTQYIGAIAK